jgi:hypothetical protein
MTYAWVVTRDLLDGKDVSINGPRGCAFTAEHITQNGIAFRMRDDDGVPYYQGFYLGPDTEDMFGPLDDYGTPNSGCTEIQYRDADGNWKTL